MFRQALIFFIFLTAIHADDSIKTISYTTCTEPYSFFNSNNCQFYTSFFATVAVIGGGEHSQLINVVANSIDKTVTITDNDVGAVSCPAGVACTILDPPVTVSIIRSPIPDSTMRVIPGGNTSFGFAYALTLDTDVTKSGLPYAYQIDEQDASTAPGSVCLSNDPSTISIDQVDPSVLQSQCGVGSIDLRGTCGSPSLAPLPSGWLTDNNGNPINQCAEICCGTDNSVRIRQVAPYCYAYKVTAIPILVVDFIIRIESATISGGKLDVPVYGSLNVGDSITIDSNGVRITVVASQNIPTNLLENTIANGWIIVCGNDPDSAIPNEATPVSNITSIDWFFQPLDYTPYYGDQTNGQAKTVVPIANDQHTETYGMSGLAVMQQIYKYAQTYGSSVASCNDLSMVIPNVPGYDTDNPVTPASIYNIPSYCNMWHEARSGNLAFLPPASILPNGGDIPLFNWMIRKNIGTIANPNPANADAYIIYFPNVDQINASPYKNDLFNAIQFKIDFAIGTPTTFPYVTNYGDTSMPVEIVQTNNVYPGTVNKPIATPSCFFQYPPEVPKNSLTGGGLMVVQLRSTLTAGNVQVDGISNPTSNIEVSLSCTAVPKAGNNSETATIAVTSASPVTVPPLGANQVSDPILFNLSATFHNTYTTTAIKNSVIANCDVHVVYNTQSPSQGSFTESFQCKVSTTLDTINDTPQKCTFVDIPCHHPWWKSGMFWVSIVCFLILLAIIGIVIWQAVLYKQKQDQVLQMKQEKMIEDNKRKDIIAKRKKLLRKKEVQDIASFVDEE
jgi:hypothetical protein